MAARTRPLAVLFDRDGTLIKDVPYNADPRLVTPLPRARAALDALRARGIAVGVVSNQSGVARGLVTRESFEAVRLRVEEALGPFAVWAACPHAPEAGCACRKPRPGLVYAACERLGVPPERTALIGDIGSDMAAAGAAGARGVLVPTAATRREEIAAAPEHAADLLAAVRLLFGPAPAATAAAAAGPPAGPAAGNASGAVARPAADAVAEPAAEPLAGTDAAPAARPAAGAVAEPAAGSVAEPVPGADAEPAAGYDVGPAGGSVAGNAAGADGGRAAAGEVPHER
ncbi:D-glycero-alpha-D-manno-heptose-1,7-bisphosphate 7-phosphatase [Streptomyces hoynatensis]|uniref:D-glycero-alpha-D-manno-heptose-1,7-bisphosphate 7-phosphatase n=1 Tax=Streptomyces hoynatensis TaxID=1141874 RepID=UPI003BAB573B